MAIPLSSSSFCAIWITPLSQLADEKDEPGQIELPQLKSIYVKLMYLLLHTLEMFVTIWKAEAITEKETALIHSYNSMVKFHCTSQAKQTCCSDSNFHD